MAQRMVATFGIELRELCLPDPWEKLMPGVMWGRFDEFFTPAYWKGQYWQSTEVIRESSGFRIGSTLAEEAAACCLGGHGIPAEVGLAAFRALRDRGVLSAKDITGDAIYAVLGGTLTDGKKSFRYRFARQKSNYLAPLLQAIHSDPPNDDDALEFRAWFLRFSDSAGANGRGKHVQSSR